MANNNFSSVITFILMAMDQISRELVGHIPSVYRNSSAERAMLGQTITYPIVPAVVGEDFLPSQLPPDTGETTVSAGSMTISKSRAFPVKITGEERQGLANMGVYERIMTDRFTQAIRAGVNEIEADLAALYTRACRAYGTAGTTPFATTFADAASANKILDDNGVPRVNRSLVIDTAAALSFKSLPNYMQAMQAGGDDFKRGILLPLDGLDIRQSAQNKLVTKGTGSAYTSTAAGFPVGTTSIPLITGSGTVLAGDVVTFAGDLNKYVVATGVAAPGTIVLAAPGLRQALPASATAMTIGNNYRANLLYHRDAVQLVTRTPAEPDGGDSASDTFTVTDPISGLAFEVRLYKFHGLVKYEVCIAWGCQIVKPEWAAILLG